MGEVKIVHEQDQRRFVVANGSFAQLVQWVFDGLGKGGELQSFRNSNYSDEQQIYIAEMYFKIEIKGA